jgi:hypothetical protein
MRWHLNEEARIWILVILMSAVDLTEEEELLKRMMMKYWANFARNG